MLRVKTVTQCLLLVRILMDKEYERTFFFNLQQEIPFATQQAWQRKKERKESIVSV